MLSLLLDKTRLPSNLRQTSSEYVHQSIFVYWWKLRGTHHIHIMRRWPWSSSLGCCMAKGWGMYIDTLFSLLCTAFCLSVHTVKSGILCYVIVCVRETGVWNFFPYVIVCLCVPRDVRRISMVVLHFSMSVCVVCFTWYYLLERVEDLSQYMCVVTNLVYS